MGTLESASWQEIQAFRDRIAEAAARAASLCEAAQSFSESFVTAFPSIVLCRVFGLVAYGRLPAHDAGVAAHFAEGVGAQALLTPKTRVLSLLGSYGAEPAWNDRLKSAGHLAIPLLSRDLVEGIPMIAQLLADLGVEVAYLGDARPIESRRLLGSSNQCFFVDDAAKARDQKGRLIIAAQPFVAAHHIRTVFGMAGSYVEGTMVAAICFTNEALDKLTVDRFPSVIANFKMATTPLVLSGRVYAPADNAG